MFSGLTNQLNSLVGAVKGQNDEEVPAPTQEAAAAEAAASSSAAATIEHDATGAEHQPVEGEEAAKRYVTKFCCVFQKFFILLILLYDLF